MFYADPAQFDPAFAERLLPLLPPEKQTALQSVRHARSRRESLLGWGLLVFAWRFSAPNTPLPPLSFAERGKPFFKSGALHFNLSHTDTLVCLALSETGKIGVDAQTPKNPSDALVRKVLTPAERAVYAAADDKAMCFTRFWTQKEALVKQTGEGLSHGFDTLDFAPFAGQDSFSAFGCDFLSETLCGAAVTQCAEHLPSAVSCAVTQAQMEKVLFFEKDG